MGSRWVLDMLEAVSGEVGSDVVQAEACGCLGKCGDGPNLLEVGSGTIHRGVQDVSSLVAVVGAGIVPDPLERVFRLKEAGNRHLSNEKPREACEAYGEALDALQGREEDYLAKMRLSLLCNMTAAHLDLSEDDAAYRNVTAALDLDPKFAPAWKRMGDVHVRLKEVDEAVAAYETAMRLDPSCSDDAKRRIAMAKRATKLFGIF